jgi:hypothetical protein
VKRLVTPEVLARILKLRAEGLGPTIIAKRMGLGKGTVIKAYSTAPFKAKAESASGEVRA